MGHLFSNIYNSNLVIFKKIKLSHQALVLVFPLFNLNDLSK